jgi:hypothetical protein
MGGAIDLVRDGNTNLYRNVLTIAGEMRPGGFGWYHGVLCNRYFLGFITALAILTLSGVVSQIISLSYGGVNIT